MCRKEDVFKAGDRVYYPMSGVGIHTLTESRLSGGSYPILIHNMSSFTREGLHTINQTCQSIFHATEENRALLSKLYGVEFEKPCHPVEEALKTSDHVWCFVSDDGEYDALASKRLARIVRRGRSTASTRETFTTSVGVIWYYAVVANIQIKNGAIVSE